MFQTAGYPAHPPHFSQFEYRSSPPRTPQHAGRNSYYSPRQYSYSATPTKGHARRSTGDPATFASFKTTSYSTPRKTYLSQPEYSSPGYRASAQSTPLYKSDYVPIYTPADTLPKETPRHRRASYTAKPTQTTPPRRKPSTKPKTPPKATESDARAAGIPAGYSLKNWDPTEEPILLLGSVFDANSLGKYIYDWTVYCYGAATPMSEVAGELWLLLIQLAGKIKRAEECLPRIRQLASRDLVDDFLESGERLWGRFTRLLKICEGFMWEAARRETSASASASADDRGAKVTMGRNSGCEFVEAIFGRDRELERTEKLMTGMRLWSMRFDANCEEVLRNPSA